MSTFEASLTLVQNSLCSTQILIVEDNTTNRLLLRDYLIHAGYTVSTLECGTDFFPTIAQVQPRLILLDLKLPDVDGYTLLQQLRQHRDWRDIPVIVVSAFAFRADQQRALALGAQHYLVKPVDLATLNRTVARELQGLPV
jgi:CheY-like chemotaxis protein